MKIITNRKIFIKALIVVICSAAIFLFVYNNCEFYSQPIAKITEVNESETSQSIKAVIKNGEKQGVSIQIEHHYDPALAYDEKYHKGDFIFISQDEKQVTGVKRDYQTVLATLLLFSLLLIFGGRQGSFTVISVIISIALLLLMVTMYMRGWDILGLSIAACILFSVVVLLFTCGWNEKALIALSATMGATFIVGLLAFILIWTGKNIGYDYLDFLPEPYTISEANHFFFAQVLIGCIGAVMDISVTITACSTELIRKTPDIGVKQMTQSVKEIADDITGTMINVVFFTNVAALIPTFIISMKNDISFITVIKYDAYFEIVRFLIAAISILVAIPISVMFSSLFLKRRKAA